MDASRRGGTFGFDGHLAACRFGQHFYAFAFDLSTFQNSGNQFFLMALDFKILHLHFAFFFDEADFHSLGRNLLLHDIRLNVIGFVGLGLLALDGLHILGATNFEIALRFGLSSER